MRDAITRMLKQFAQENKILLGVCDAEKLSVPKPAPFVKYSGDERSNPRLALPGAKSIIVIGAGYGKTLNFTDDGKPRGHFSINAAGLDYHIRLSRILSNLRDFLISAANFESRIFVDTGPLEEKTLAMKAGLGNIGKNGLVISKAGYGSFFNIGYMLTTLELEPFSAVDDDTAPCCGGCDSCITACPGGALSENGFDYRYCVSYLTQKKEELTPPEKKLLGLNLYGCDACQTACPLNIGAHSGEINDIESVSPMLDGLIHITRREFNERYRNTAIYWRGAGILRRNAEIAMENFINNTKI